LTCSALGLRVYRGYVLDDGGLTLGTLIRVVIGILVSTGLVMLAAWSSWELHDRRIAKRTREHREARRRAANPNPPDAAAYPIRWDDDDAP
jgi:hypothetical protein